MPPKKQILGSALRQIITVQTRTKKKKMKQSFQKNNTKQNTQNQTKPNQPTTKNDQEMLYGTCSILFVNLVYLSESTEFILKQ